jgi:PAS domain S-box-containing protein
VSFRAVNSEYSRVVETLPLAVVVTDEKGVVESTNPAATQLFGATASELATQSLLELLHLDDQSDDILDELHEQGSLHRLARLQTTAVDVYAARDHGSAEETVTWLLTPSRSPVDGEALPRALVALTRLVAVAEGAEELLPQAAQICQNALGDMVSVSLMIGSPTEPQVVASTSTLAQAVDGAQVMADEGPCATAYETVSTVVSKNLHDDERWPRLARHLTDVNASGVVAAPLVLDDKVVGALNVFTTAEHGPDGQQVRSCELLATSVGALIHELRRRGELQATAAGLEQALTSRSVIDMAKGIVMADKRCTPDEAFQHLVDLSSRNHVKLRDLANLIVTRASGGPAPTR